MPGFSVSRSCGPMDKAWVWFGSELCSAHSSPPYVWHPSPTRKQWQGFEAMLPEPIGGTGQVVLERKGLRAGHSRADV